MVYHLDEILLDMGFSFNWSAAYALCVLKLRYNQNCSFLVQNHISDFQKNCAHFSITSIVLNDVNIKGGNVIKPFAREIGSVQNLYRYSR